MIPAIGIDGVTGSLLVLVVAQHDIGTLCQDFSRDVLRIATVDANRHVESRLTAGAGNEVLIVLVADDGGALRGTIAHGVSEPHVVQEGLHLLVEGCATNDDLVEIAAEGIGDLLADHLAYLLADDRHMEEHTHTVVLNFGEHLLADDFLNDQGNGDDHRWFDTSESLGDDGGTRDAGEVEHMTAPDELEDELERHAIHVSHWQDADNRVAALEFLAQYVAREIDIAPEGTVGNHHTLGESRGTAGVVDQRQFFGTLLDVIADMFLTEIFGILDAKQFVEVFTGIGEFVGTRHHQRVVGDVDDTLQSRHLRGVDLCSHDIAHEEQFGIAVVHDVVNLVGHELMQDGHSHGTIGEGGEESHRPVGTVASAKSDLVALCHTRVLEHDVEFLYLSCHIVILQGRSLVVCQCIHVPMVDDALLNQCVKARYFHTSFFL